MNLIKVGTSRAAGLLKKRLLPMIAGSLVAALLAAGIVLGLFHTGRKASWHLLVSPSTQGSSSEQDQLSISSAERDTTAEKGRESSTGAEQNEGRGNGAEKRNELLAQQQQQLAAAQQAAAQQAAQEAALAEKNRELDQREAEQAARGNGR